MTRRPLVTEIPVWLFVLSAGILVGLGGALLSPPALGQSAPRERRKLKDFGSSLERLKWDPEKGAAVETRPRKGKEKKAEAEEEEEVVRVETSLVVCDVLVLDRQGGAVTGLTRDDFVVNEDGRPQQLGTFSLGDDARVPRTIVLIIDYSGSQFPFIKTSVEAAKTLVDRLGPRDVLAIVTDDVEMIQDFTADKEKLKKKLDTLVKRATEPGGFLAQAFGRGGRRFGRSAQYSALLATLKEAFDGEDLRPVIIFQTDGDELSLLREPVVEPVVPPNLPPDLRDEAVKSYQRVQRMLRENRREFSLGDVYAAAEKSRATVYTVIPGYRLVGLTSDELLKQGRAYHERFLSASGAGPEEREAWEKRYARMPPEALKVGLEMTAKVQLALVDLARLTGGWADYLDEPSRAPEIYSRIFTDVNRRYIIGYYPANKERDGTRREVKVEVRGHPEYTVWGRRSYYAPGPDQ